MHVARHLSFGLIKKEPLAEMIVRIRRAFLDAQLGEPAIRFTFVDTALKKGIAIDRILKRYPEMERFLKFTALLHGGSESRVLSNATTGEAAESSIILSIAAGVPRSYPLSGVWLHFYAPAFGARLIGLPKMGDSFPGVIVTDNWWVTGRKRALSVYTVVEAQAGDKKLPDYPEPVNAAIKRLGKITSTIQVPIRGADGEIVGSIPRENAEAVNAIVADYRARLKDIVAQANLPHDLPPGAEIRAQNAGVLAGPRKPALEAAFRPMGYACRGGSGVFHLTRKTAGNLMVELYLDVGTWSHSISAHFMVQGAGFKASIGVPVCPQEGFAGQYPIGDAAQWQKIVDNLAAMVRELEGSFLPGIERAAGPSPAWYQPTG
jgi:hypothetical protein